MPLLGYSIVQPESDIFWFWTAARNIKWLSGVQNYHFRFHRGFKEVVLNYYNFFKPMENIQFLLPLLLLIHHNLEDHFFQPIWHLALQILMHCYSSSEQPNHISHLKSWNELHSDFKGTVQSSVITWINTPTAALLHEWWYLSCFTEFCWYCFVVLTSVKCWMHDLLPFYTLFTVVLLLSF